MEEGFKILIDRGESHFGVDLRIGEVRNGVLYVAKPIKLIFEQREFGRRIPPTMEFETANGLQFLDALKTSLNEHKGIREGHVEGELKATKEHLKDMRLLAFHKVGIKEAFQPTGTDEYPRR